VAEKKSYVMKQREITLTEIFMCI